MINYDGSSFNPKHHSTAQHIKMKVSPSGDAEWWVIITTNHNSTHSVKSYPMVFVFACACVYTVSHSLLQLFLRVSEGAARSARTAPFLLHVTTHVRLVLAVLGRLRQRGRDIELTTWTTQTPSIHMIRWYDECKTCATLLIVFKSTSHVDFYDILSHAMVPAHHGPMVYGEESLHTGTTNCIGTCELTCCGSAPFLLWFWMKSTRPCTTVFTATRPFSSCSHVGGGASANQYVH